MDQKEFDALMAKIKVDLKPAVQTEMEDTVKGLLTIDQFNEKMTAVGLEADTLKTLTDAIEKQGLELKKIFDGQAEPKSISEQVVAQKQKMLDIQSGKARVLTFDVKTDVLRASVTNSTQAIRLPEIGKLDTERIALAPLFRAAKVGPNSAGVIRYIDQASATRNADTVAEGAQIPESAMTWQEYSLTLEKIGDSIPISLEMLADVDFVEGELRRLLEINIALKENAQLYDGNGATPNLKGVYTSAGTYTAVAAGISDANIYDLIVKMHENISGGNEKYSPNYVLMNITDINQMRLHKDSNNNYLIPPFVSPDGKVVAGITVIPTNRVTADTLLMGDFNYATLHGLDAYKVELGYIDKQFIEDMVTLKATKREALLIRTIDEGGFKKCTGIAAALVTLAS